MSEYTKAYLTLLPQFIILIPAAVLCYMPMKSRLRFSLKKTVIYCLAIFAPYAALSAGACLIWKLDMNIILIPSLALLFLFYRRSVRAGLSCSLSIFLGVCTLMTFPAQFAYAFDAWLHPDSGSANFSMEAALFQLAMCCVFLAVFAVPCTKAYSKLVEKLSDTGVWYSLMAVHCILFLLNFLMIPYSYPMLFVGRIFPSFLALEAVMLLLFVLLHVIFYHIANFMLKHTELIQHSRLLEMQAEQYQTIQNHMKQTRLLRHDFRQSVHILTSMAEKDDLSGLKSYLREYEQRMDAEASVNYCSNAALNALFNYYKTMADSRGINTLWQISIPEPLTVSELDISSLMGNLMENAIAGCGTVPEGERRFALSVEVRQGNFLYIVSTNSFDGRARKSANGYLSTKQTGEGLGLLSISSVAEKYNGYARASHDEQNFMMDIMIKI